MSIDYYYKRNAEQRNYIFELEDKVQELSLKIEHLKDIAKPPILTNVKWSNTLPEVVHEKGVNITMRDFVMLDRLKKFISTL